MRCAAARRLGSVGLERLSGGSTEDGRVAADGHCDNDDAKAIVERLVEMRP